ncbi:unnamed protein product [Arctogadus glacialis]
MRRLLKVAPDAMYLTDDSNGAIFPLPSGEFPIGSMMTMANFEVQGQPTPAAPPTPGHFGKTFQRSINVGEVAGNRILTKKTLVVRFSEAEANVEAILLKTREALGQGEFEDLQQQRQAKVSRREDNTLLDRAEEVKVAAESLENVANAIKKLSEVATAHLQRPSLQPAKDAMSCLVCKAVFVDPQFATCCESLVGCRVCVQRWCASSDFCLKCRAANFAANVLAVRGLSPAADFFRDFEVDA